MANSNTPRGFKPVRMVTGAYYNGAVNKYRLNSGYATNLFVGDCVKLLTTGYLAKASAGDQFRGVVQEISYVGANNSPVYPAYWAGGTVTLNGADVQVMVIDDPLVMFEAVFTNSTSVPAVTDIGAMFNLFDAGGNTFNGLSGEGVDYTTSTTSAAQWRFEEFVPRVDNDPTSAYSRGWFSPSLHDRRVNTGI